MLRETRRRAIQATTGDNTIVAARAGYRIKVTSCFGTSDASGLVRWESGVGGTALTGQSPIGTEGGYVLPHNAEGWFITGIGEALNLELTTATVFAGCLNFELVPETP